MEEENNGRKGKSATETGLDKCDFDITSTYAPELQGLINYYAFAQTVYEKMTARRFVWFNSLAKTLAGKHKTSKGKIFKDDIRYGADGRKVIVAEVKREGKKPLIATFGKKPIERKTKVVIGDEITQIYSKRNAFVTRRLANRCELCGSEEEVEGHHIKKRKDLKKRYEGRREKPDWVTRMIAINRKILFGCGECHDKIHAGTYDRRKLV